MPRRLYRILIVLAGGMGADGVMLAAAAAHQADASRLASASSMLLFHALAVLGNGGAGGARRRSMSGWGSRPPGVLSLPPHCSPAT